MEPYQIFQIHNFLWFRNKSQSISDHPVKFFWKSVNSWASSVNTACFWKETVLLGKQRRPYSMLSGWQMYCLHVWHSLPDLSCIWLAYTIHSYVNILLDTNLHKIQGQQYWCNTKRFREWHWVGHEWVSVIVKRVF